MTDYHLTQGNTAKLYCLNFIDQLASERSGVQTILDLGCGTGLNFVALLKKHPCIRYIGVEPSRHACDAARNALQGLNVDIRNEFAYDVTVPPVDVVVSFSVLEHVYRRQKYLECAKRNLAPDGVFLINYDAGHFVMPGSLRPGIDRWLNSLSPIKAALGYEKSYQSFVRENDFKSLVQAVGLKIIDEKMFNTDLKTTYRFVPSEYREQFMVRWLALELDLNAMGITYADSVAHVFRTRNFILMHRPD